MSPPRLWRVSYPAVLVVAMLASTAAHALVFASMRDMPPRERRPRGPIEMAVLAPEPPPPPAPKAPPPPLPPARKLERRRAPVRGLAEPVAATPPRSPPPEAPAEPAAPQAAPPTFGISFSSTSSGGSFRVAVGDTLMKEPEPKLIPEPKPEPRPYVAPISAVTKLPSKLGECEAIYPPEARRQGREGEVLLDVEIDATGRVSAVRVVRGLVPELDAAAARALRTCRFSPAEQTGTPVATRIRYTYTFVIES